MNPSSELDIGNIRRAAGIDPHQDGPVPADEAQATASQRDALLAAVVDDAQLYSDLASGRKDDRAGLLSCLKAHREGDALVMWKLDHLGREAPEH